MSYYHYFKLKEDSKYHKYDPPKFTTDDSVKQKILLKGVMVDSYYEKDIRKKYDNIAVYTRMIAYSIESSYTNSLVKEIKSSGEISRNRPGSEYEMENRIDEYENNLNRVIENLFILSLVKFVPDEKYSDTSKDEMTYLRYDYIHEIESEIEYLEDVVLDYTFAKFVVNECTRETEDERYSKEESEEE